MNKFRNFIKESEVEKVYLTPEEYIELLKKVNFQAYAIPKLPRFKGKKIVVNGNLDLSKIAKNKNNFTSLGPIEIKGSLNVSYTNIQTLDDVHVNGYRSYWSTPYERVEERRKLQKKYAELESKKEDDEWNINDTDDEGEMANAVYEFAINNRDVDGLDSDDMQTINELKSRILELEEEQENLSTEDENYDEKFDEIEEEIEEIKSSIEDLMDGKVDVYDFYPTGSHYSMNTFECLSTRYTYAVGDYRDADDSLQNYIEKMVDDMNSYFSQDYLEGYISGDEVADEFEYSVREMVEESPDDYNISRQLSDEQEEEIWLLEMEKWVYQNEGVRAPISLPTKEDGPVFDFEDSEDNRFQYRRISQDANSSRWELYKNGEYVKPFEIYEDEDTPEHEEERESRISDIDYEIEEIKDNPDGDSDPDEIENEIEDQLSDIRRDPLRYLKDYGYDNFSNFIDKDQLADDLFSEYDYGNLNSYDGSYDIIDINGTDYVVMRID